MTTYTEKLIVQCCHCWATQNDDDTWTPHGKKINEASHTICRECIMTNPMYATIRVAMVRRMGW